jgi:hypothetical protein
VTWDAIVELLGKALPAGVPAMARDTRAPSLIDDAGL